MGPIGRYTFENLAKKEIFVDFSSKNDLDLWPFELYMS